MSNFVVKMETRLGEFHFDACIFDVHPLVDKYFGDIQSVVDSAGDLTDAFEMITARSTNTYYLYHSICWKHTTSIVTWHFSAETKTAAYWSGVGLSLNARVFGNNKCEAFSLLLPDFESVQFLLLLNNVSFRSGIGAIYFLGQHFTHIITTHFHTYITHSVFNKKTCSRNNKKIGIFFASSKSCFFRSFFIYFARLNIH